MGLYVRNDGDSAHTPPPSYRLKVLFLDQEGRRDLPLRGAPLCIFWID
jgi:hypothetical protein